MRLRSADANPSHADQHVVCPTYRNGLLDQPQWRSVEQDRQFDFQPAARCGNAILTRTASKSFGDQYNVRSSKLSGVAETAETCCAAVAEHEAVVLALEAGDPLLAEAAMRVHLKASTEC